MTTKTTKTKKTTTAGVGAEEIERLEDAVIVRERLQARRRRREELGDELPCRDVEVAAGAALGVVDEEKAAEGEMSSQRLELAAGGRRELVVARQIKERRLEELVLRERHVDGVVAPDLDGGADGELGAEARQAR